MFRLYAMTFLGKFRGTHEQEHHLHESPSAITIPLIVLAVLSVIGGFIGIPELFAHDAHRLGQFLEPVFRDSAKHLHAHHVDHQTEWVLLGASVLIAVAGSVAGYIKFSRNPDLQDAKGFGSVLENKWYVDELYDNIIAKPLLALGKLFDNVIEKSGIDGVVNGVGKSIQYGSRQLRLLQSGQVGNYILLMVVSILIFFVIEFFLKK
jgi:NADH-quinone oxidoreductase subunit L